MDILDRVVEKLVAFKPDEKIVKPPEWPVPGNLILTTPVVARNGAATTVTLKFDQERAALVKMWMRDFLTSSGDEIIREFGLKHSGHRVAGAAPPPDYMHPDELWKNLLYSVQRVG